LVIARFQSLDHEHSPVGPDDVTAAAAAAKESWYNQRRQFVSYVIARAQSFGLRRLRLIKQIHDHYGSRLTVF